MVLHIKGKKGEDEVEGTLLRSVITIPVVIMGVWFLGQMLGLVNKEEYTTFKDMADRVNEMRDTEVVWHNIYLRGNYLYGFNANGGTVEKPSDKACAAGACMCICKSDCAKKEERSCRKIEGISSFYSDSKFEGLNLGAKQGNNYFLALDGTKGKGIVCTAIKRSKETVTFGMCKAQA